MSTSDVAAWAEKLNAMTADEIAALLREENVTGAQTSTAECPIAMFLRRKGKVRHIMVTGGLVEWAEIVTDASTGAIPYLEYGRRLTPGGIREFVIRFDNGAFSDLQLPRSSRVVATPYHQIQSLSVHSYSDYSDAYPHLQPA